MPRAFFARSPGVSTVMFATTCYGATLRRQAGYALGFAMHF